MENMVKIDALMVGRLLLVIIHAINNKEDLCQTLMYINLFYIMNVGPSKYLNKLCRYSCLFHLRQVLEESRSDWIYISLK